MGSINYAEASLIPEQETAGQVKQNIITFRRAHGLALLSKQTSISFVQ